MNTNIINEENQNISEKDLKFIKSIEDKLDNSSVIRGMSKILYKSILNVFNFNNDISKLFNEIISNDIQSEDNYLKYVRESISDKILLDLMKEIKKIINKNNIGDDLKLQINDFVKIIIINNIKKLKVNEPDFIENDFKKIKNFKMLDYFDKKFLTKKEIIKCKNKKGLKSYNLIYQNCVFNNYNILDEISKQIINNFNENLNNIKDENTKKRLSNTLIFFKKLIEENDYHNISFFPFIDLTKIEIRDNNNLVKIKLLQLQNKLNKNENPNIYTNSLNKLLLKTVDNVLLYSDSNFIQKIINNESYTTDEVNKVVYQIVLKLVKNINKKYKKFNENNQFINFSIDIIIMILINLIKTNKNNIEIVKNKLKLKNFPLPKNYILIKLFTILSKKNVNSRNIKSCNQSDSILNKKKKLILCLFNNEILTSLSQEIITYFNNTIKIMMNNSNNINITNKIFMIGVSGKDFIKNINNDIIEPMTPVKCDCKIPFYYYIFYIIIVSTILYYYYKI